MHYKRYSKDKWLPDPEDATTYLSDNDRYGILVFNVRVLLHKYLPSYINIIFTLLKLINLFFMTSTIL